jgi:oligosaccharide repeat unit polymerase
VDRLLYDNKKGGVNMSYKYRDASKIRISRSSDIYYFVTVFFFLLLFLYLIGFSLGSMGTVTSVQINMANITLIFVYLLAVVSWLKITKNYFSLYLVFIIYSFLFNAGQTLTQYIPNYGYTYLNIYRVYSNEYIFKMLIFQTLVIIAMHFGALLAYKLFRGRHFDITKVPVKNIQKKSIVLDFTFYLSSALMLLYSFIQLALRMEHSYADYYALRDPTSQYITAIFYWSFISYFLRHSKDNKKLMYSIIILQILAMLIVGRRTLIIPMIASLLFLQIITTPSMFLNKRRVLKLIIFGLVGAFLVGVSAEMRSLELQGISTQIKWIFSKQGFMFYVFNSLQEMGVSARTIIVTMMKIDGGFQHQSTIFYDLAKAFIPTSILSNFGVNVPEVGQLSTWVTSLSSSSSGWGYSFIAEAYFNFGMLGFIFTGIYGFIISFLEFSAIKNIHEGKILLPTVIVYLLSHQLFYARAHFGLITGPIRLVIYLLIISAIYNLIIGNKSHKLVNSNGVDIS